MYASFLILLPAVLGQYAIDMGMKPDVRFDERNERYDIGPLIDPGPGEYVEQEYRRQGARQQTDYYDPNQNIKDILHLINDNIQKNRQSPSTANNKDMLSQLVELVHQVRRSGDATKISSMKKMEDQTNYARSLHNFRAQNKRRNLVEYLHGQPELSPTRRSEFNPDREVLLHHAVPISMTIQGFLKMPVSSD